MRIFLEWLIMLILLPFIAVLEVAGLIWDWLTFPIRRYRDGEKVD